jgi:3'(2'), 5'-bisphosphate nucleotidase
MITSAGAYAPDFNWRMAHSRCCGWASKAANFLDAAGTVSDLSVTERSDSALAADLATRAGALLMSIRAELGFGNNRRLKDAGDKQAHDFLSAVLSRERPDDALLSEEGADSSARLSADRVWIVDPLDGTREFGEAGRVDWAVHVALVVAGELSVGAVSLPAQQLVFATGSELPPLPELPEQVRIIASRSRAPQVVADVAEVLAATIVPLGSAGAKAMAVVRGDAEVYVHAGGQYEWDSAAPVAVARAAGLHTSRLDGSPLVYNQRDPYLPDLVICRRELADAVLSVTSS